MKHSSKYDEAMAFIHGALKLGSKLGLDNIRELTRRLGSPQDKFRCVHVAGTNGKGTASTAIGSILTAEGYRTGVYTSPFVYDFTERMAVDGVCIGEEMLANCALRVREACDAMVADGLAHPTEFEIVTAIGFLYFADAKCDFVVLEVGLGGRLDATNVIAPPLCAVITAIGFDHMEYLGNSLSAIAAEKCGIIKPNSTVVCYPFQPPEAQAVIEETCRERGVACRIAPPATVHSCDLHGSTFDCGTFTDLHLPLIGEHMAQNVATALEAVRVLRENGVAIGDAAIYKGIGTVVHRGRFEILREKPLFIVDGAHNIDGIRALRDTISRTLSGKRLVFITGMLRDKEYDAAMACMGGIAETVIVVTVPSPRALSAAELGAVAERYNDRVVVAADCEDAVRRAEACHADAVIAFGSLYMLGDIAKFVAECERDGG